MTDFGQAVFAHLPRKNKLFTQMSDAYHCRWLKINELAAAFTISTTQYFNHLNWNYCKSDLLISEKRLDVLIDARAGFWIHFWADVQRLRYDVFSMHRVNFVMRWPKLSTLKKRIKIAFSIWIPRLYLFIVYLWGRDDLVLWSWVHHCMHRDDREILLVL